MRRLSLLLCPILVLALTATAHAAPAAGATAQATSSTSATANDAATTNYDPQALFAPFRYQYPVNRYRSSNGMPGPDFWQNRADYVIRATLDPKAKKLSASVVITYTNHSPDTLDRLWLQLDQNRYRTDARANFSGGRAPTADRHTRGYRIASVEVGQGGDWQPAGYLVSDTRMRIALPQALAPNGGKVRVRIVYSYTVPGRFGGRNDWYATRNGDVFEIAQWFPRLCVYDDLRGWDTAPFLNNEFYLEYGDIDYYVTVPWDFLVVGSGELVNPQDVLTAAQRERVAKARRSDTTVMIRSAAEVTDPSSRPKQSGTLTWHFHMDNTRDVAFGASAAYVWDAARINLSNGKHALAQSAYPVESIGKDGWQDSTQGVKYTIEYFSSELGFDYPWPNAVAEAGTAGGMEYPGIVFDWYKAKGYGLFMLAVHEFGHAWFPMIVGSDERRNAWMDEGFNTFVDVLAHAHWGKTHGGQFAPKSDSEYAPHGGNPMDEIQSVLSDPQAPPILTRADAIKETYRHPVTYFKTALGMMLLRDVILGPQRFDDAFHKYVRAWAFHHPSPSDFFRAMDSAAGEDLSWFWRGWYAHNWNIDMAVLGVGYVKDDPAKGALVTVAALDKLVLPATLHVTLADGSTRDVRVPVATWIQHREYAVAIDSTQKVVSAVLDPDHAIPDADRGNNRWPAH